MKLVNISLLCSLFITLQACDPNPQISTPDEGAGSLAADLLLTNGYVYTADQQRSVAQAVAVRNGEILAVGSSEEVAAYAGPETQTIDLAGRMLMPGLHDAHIHVFGIVLPDVCSLESAVLSLAEMVPVLQECIQRYQLAPGEWLAVDMWNFSEGNQTSEQLPNLRAALDAVSTEHPIILWGNDGHHGAVNSAALAEARAPDGEVVGLDAETLRTTFADLREVVGVDARGEPNGALHEHARNIVGSGPRRDPAKLAALLPEINHVLASHGITSVQDAALEPAYLPYLKAFEQDGNLKFRIQVANRLEPADYADPLTGRIDTDAMLAELQSARAMFDGDNSLVRPAAVKIFADGVMEGNPYGDPPTLPNAAMLTPFRQPLFNFDPASDQLTVQGYVDTDSELCVETRARAEQLLEGSAIEAFRAEHGFHPAQCTISTGVYADQLPFVMGYVQRLDEAGFTIHVHAIGDRAVRLAVDALAQVTPADGSNPLRHSLAHLQVVHPDDQQRIGEMGLYLAWTYAWMLTNPPYDMTVIPFQEDITTPAGVYDPGTYYFNNAYPVRSTMQAGAVPVAGSDAPVDARSPRPFINMAIGITRMGEDGGVLNADEALDIHDMIAAYTINGAHALNQENLTGSIVPGKRADFAVLDRNIVELYDSGKALEILETRVDLTVFDGEVIFER
jgi:predicted amidohydrolase YtcJ